MLFQVHQNIQYMQALGERSLLSYVSSLLNLAPRGICVNTIAPGAVAVENHFKAISGYDPEANGQLIPCGFEGEALDIAKVAVFLASEGARYIVGQTLIADGGTTSWMSFHDGFRQSSTARFGRGYVRGL